MKNYKPTILSFVLFIFLIFSCKTNQNSVDNQANNKSCNIEAEVIDFSGLSSCSYLLKLKDGSFLNPVDGYPRQDLVAAQKVKIGYTSLPDAMSTCMKGTLVNITCFKVTKKGTPQKGDF